MAKPALFVVGTNCILAGCRAPHTYGLAKAGFGEELYGFGGISTAC